MILQKKGDFHLYLFFISGIKKAVEKIITKGDIVTKGYWKLPEETMSLVITEQQLDKELAMINETLDELSHP